MRGQRFYRNKPYVPVRINRDHPYAKHLIFAIDPLQGELVHGNSINYVGGYSKVATAGGAAYTTTTAQYGEIADHAGIQNQGEIFIYAVTVGGDWQRISKNLTNAQTNCEFDFVTNHPSVGLYWIRSNSGYRVWKNIAAVGVANTINIFSISQASNIESTPTGGWNGSIVTMSLDSGTGTGVNGLSGKPIRLNRRDDAASSNSGNIIFAAAFRRNLGAEGHVLLGNNPYDIVEPIRKIFTFYSAVSDTQLSGSAIGVAASSGVLTTSIPLAGAALSSAGASGQVTTAIALAGGAASVSAAGGNLTAAIRLSGAAISAAAAAAGLTTAVKVSGAAQSTSAATGNLTIQIRLQGAALSQAIASGSLDAGSGISGAASVAAAASGALTTAIPVIGAVLSVSGASGALSTAIPLGSAAAASAQASANLGTNIQLGGVAASVTSGVGSLNTAITLTGNAVAQALSGGNLMANITLSGAAVAQVAANGELNAAASVPTPISRTLRIVSEYRALRANSENRILRAA